MRERRPHITGMTVVRELSCDQALERSESNYDNQELLYIDPWLICHAVSISCLLIGSCTVGTRSDILVIQYHVQHCGQTELQCEMSSCTAINSSPGYLLCHSNKAMQIYRVVCLKQRVNLENANGLAKSTSCISPFKISRILPRFSRFRRLCDLDGECSLVRPLKAANFESIVVFRGSKDAMVAQSDRLCVESRSCVVDGAQFDGSEDSGCHGALESDVGYAEHGMKQCRYGCEKHHDGYDVQSNSRATRKKKKNESEHRKEMFFFITNE